MVSGCLAKVVSSDVRHNFLPHYLAAVGLLLITPVVFGLAGLSERMAAQPLEIISPLIGTVLMTPVFMPEQNEVICDVVRSKKTSHILVCFLRLVCAVVLTVALVGLLSAYMRYNESKVTARLFLSAAGSGIALGSLGFFAAAVGDNSVIGYMVSLSYLLMNMFMRSKLGVFDLFTFTGGKTDVNIWLYVTAVVLVALALLLRRVMRK